MPTRIIPKAIAAALVADGTVNGFVSGRVYARLAKVGAAYPYVVILLNAGQSVNDAPSKPIDYRYTVKAVDTSQTVAAQVASAINSALHQTTLSLDDPWKLLQCQHMTEFEYIEDAEHNKVFHMGGVYRIRANQ